MGTMGFPAADRWDLEDAWRVRVEMKEHAYRTAAERYERLLTATSEVHSPEVPGNAVAAARVAAERAFEEYTRVLRTFTALTLHGRVPDESITPEAFSE